MLSEGQGGILNGGQEWWYHAPCLLSAFIYLFIFKIWNIDLSLIPLSAAKCYKYGNVDIFMVLGPEKGWTQERRDPWFFVKILVLRGLRKNFPSPKGLSWVHLLDWSADALWWHFHKLLVIPCVILTLFFFIVEKAYALTIKRSYLKKSWWFGCRWHGLKKFILWRIFM